MDEHTKRNRIHSDDADDSRDMDTFKTSEPLNLKQGDKVSILGWLCEYLSPENEEKRKADREKIAKLGIKSVPISQIINNMETLIEQKEEVIINHVHKLQIGSDLFIILVNRRNNVDFPMLWESVTINVTEGKTVSSQSGGTYNNLSEYLDKVVEDCNWDYDFTQGGGSYAKWQRTKRMNNPFALLSKEEQTALVDRYSEEKRKEITNRVLIANEYEEKKGYRDVSFERDFPFIKMIDGVKDIEYTDMDIAEYYYNQSISL